MAFFTKGPLLEGLIKLINVGEALDAKYKKAEAYLEKKNVDSCFSTVYMKELDLGKLNEICGSQFKTYDVHETSPRLVTQRKNSWREGPHQAPLPGVACFLMPCDVCVHVTLLPIRELGAKGIVMGDVAAFLETPS